MIVSKKEVNPDFSNATDPIMVRKEKTDHHRNSIKNVSSNHLLTQKLT